MKKLIKICALGGLILLLAGIGITSVSAALGARVTAPLPDHLLSIWHDYKDDWDDHDDWDDWDDHDGIASPREHGSTAAPLPNNDSAITPPNHDNSTAPLPNNGNAAVPQPGHNDAGAARQGHDNPTAPHPSEGQRQENAASAAAGQDFSKAKRLEVDVDRGQVHIYEKEGISGIGINVQDEENATRYHMDGNTLKVERESRTRNGGPDIQIMVPVGYVFDEVSVDMGAAECRLDRITTAKLEIDTGVGLVSYTGTINGKAEVGTGVGDVTLSLTNAENDYNDKVECGVGSIQLGASHYSALSNDTYINNHAPYDMELECGVGSIAVSFSNSL